MDNNNKKPPTNSAPPLPHDHEAERAVIGGMLLDNGTIPAVLSILPVQAFHSPMHRRIYGAIRNLFADRKPVDMISLASTFMDAQDKGAVLNYLSEVESAVPTAANIEYYAEIVADAHHRRETAFLLQNVLDDLLDAGGKPNLEALIDDCIDSLRRVGANDWIRDEQPWDRVVGDELAGYVSGVEEGLPQGLSTGFDRIDNMTGGLRPGDAWFIGGRPSSGKSALIANLALNLAARGARTLIFTLEMPRADWLRRMVARQARVNHYILRDRRRAGDDETRRILEAHGEIGRMPIEIVDRSPITMQEIRRRVRASMKRNSRPAVIAIDYLNLIQEAKKQKEYDRLSDMATEIKMLAREFDVPVICAAQLNRASVQEHDDQGRRHVRPPRLDDFRGTGAIEQVASVVLLVHRLAADNQWDRNASIFVAKVQRGETGAVRCIFDGATQTWTEDSSGDWESQPAAPDLIPAGKKKTSPF